MLVLFFLFLLFNFNPHVAPNIKTMKQNQFKIKIIEKKKTKKFPIIMLCVNKKTIESHTASVNAILFSFTF